MVQAKEFFQRHHNNLCAFHSVPFGVGIDQREEVILEPGVNFFSFHTGQCRTFSAPCNLFVLTVLVCLTKWDAMKPQQTGQRLTARLPEPLSEQVQREARRRFCSASDIVRLSLVNFFDAECLTKQDKQPQQEEVPA